jgi:RHS repeat-associated protein
VQGTQTATPSFRLLDHLGTQVGTVDVNGVPTSISDYAPFGQLFTGGSQDPYKFTGKERDTESGNDYFGARYYASSMGRFMSPDPSVLDFADPTNPQSLNLYGYVRNNPLIFVDPKGDFCYQVNSSSNTVTIDNTAQSAGDCAKGATWIDGIATNYSYGADGVLQIGYKNGNDAGNLSFGSPDLSTDSSGKIQNPWLIDLSDNTQYNPGTISKYSMSANLSKYQGRLFDMHWCGPGGGGPPTSANDVACREHDRCYAAAGASAAMNTGAATPTSSQVAAIKACNQQMYDSVMKNPSEGSTPFLSYWLKGAFGSIYPGTEVTPPGSETPIPWLIHP